MAGHSSLIGTRAFGLLQRSGDRGQLRGRHGLLDERKELSFLATHVIGEMGAELMQGGYCRRRVASERGGSLADRYVLAQRASDQRVMGVSVFRVGGKQDLLLQAKV